MSPGSPDPAGLSPRLAALCVLAALPWLQPFAPGPSVNAVPLLVSWGCAVLALLAVPHWPRPTLWVAAALVALGAVAFALRLSPQAAAAVAAVAAASCCAAAIGADVRSARALAWAWLVAGLASSAMGLLQYFGATEAFHPLVSAASLGESFGNLRQRNQFATLTSLALVALLWLQPARPRAWVHASALLLAVANAASASRTGLLQWLAVLMLVLLWPGEQRRAQARLVLTGLAGYLAASLLLPRLLAWASGQDVANVFSRIAAGPACGTRSVLWPNVLELIAARPWSGWGWGELDYAHYWHLYARPRFCDILDNAHNLPLHLAVELGVPAALAVLVLGIWAFRRAQPWRETQPQRRAAWMAVLVILLHSLVEYPLWYGPFQLAAGFAIGLLWAPSGAALVRPSPASRLALGLVAAAALSYAAFDYARVSQLYVAAEQRWAPYREDTLARVRSSWLFGDQVAFAELTVTPLTRENAGRQHAMALQMLHFSPEPRVIERVLESALLLQRFDVLADHLERFRAAFPEEHRAWAERHGVPATARP